MSQAHWRTQRGGDLDQSHAISRDLSALLLRTNRTLHRCTAKQRGPLQSSGNTDLTVVLHAMSTRMIRAARVLPILCMHGPTVHWQRSFHSCLAVPIVTTPWIERWSLSALRTRSSTCRSAPCRSRTRCPSISRCFLPHERTVGGRCSSMCALWRSHQRAHLMMLQSLPCRSPTVLRRCHAAQCRY
jgi:hypothetical protein